jgi:hypothetical protein
MWSGAVATGTLITRAASTAAAASYTLQRIILYEYS